MQNGEPCADLDKAGGGGVQTGEQNYIDHEAGCVWRKALRTGGLDETREKERGEVREQRPNQVRCWRHGGDPGFIPREIESVRRPWSGGQLRCEHYAIFMSTCQACIHTSVHCDSHSSPVRPACYHSWFPFLSKDTEAHRQEGRRPSDKKKMQVLWTQLLSCPFHFSLVDAEPRKLVPWVGMLTTDTAKPACVNISLTEKRKWRKTMVDLLLGVGESWESFPIFFFLFEKHSSLQWRYVNMTENFWVPFK